MYDRRIKDKTLTLAVSGKLWDSSLVMVDRETQTLWSHLLGRAMRGPLIDSELRAIPSVMTDWKSWRASHPETTVVKMSRTVTNYRRGVMQGGELSNVLIGMARGEEARAWPFRELRKVKVVNETVFADGDGSGGVAVVVAYDESRGTAVIYRRKVNGRLLTFRLSEGGMLRDNETGSQWELLTGTARTGELKGQRLAAANGVISFELPWHTFYPKTKFWQPTTPR